MATRDACGGARSRGRPATQARRFRTPCSEQRWARMSSAAAAIGADELRLAQHLPLQRSLDVGLARAGFQGQRGTQGIQFEKVAMRLAGWRAGATIALFAEVV